MTCPFPRVERLPCRSPSTMAIWSVDWTESDDGREGIKRLPIDSMDAGPELMRATSAGGLGRLMCTQDGALALEQTRGPGDRLAIHDVTSRR